MCFWGVCGISIMSAWNHRNSSVFRIEGDPNEKIGGWSIKLQKLNSNILISTYISYNAPNQCSHNLSGNEYKLKE